MWYAIPAHKRHRWLIWYKLIMCRNLENLICETCVNIIRYWGWSELQFSVYHRNCWGIRSVLSKGVIWAQTLVWGFEQNVTSEVDNLINSHVEGLALYTICTLHNTKHKKISQHITSHKKTNKSHHFTKNDTLRYITKHNKKAWPKTPKPRAEGSNPSAPAS